MELAADTSVHTEVFFRATLVDDTPAEVLEALTAMVNGNDMYRSTVEHPLFACERWTWLGVCSSGNFPTPAKSALSRDRGGRLGLVLHSMPRLDDGLAALFGDWVSPYVEAPAGAYLGHELAAGSTESTPLFKV